MDDYTAIDKTKDFLEHFGILGMRWGVRRYQPYPKGHVGGKEIGEAAQRSNNQSSETRTRTSYSVKDMSDEELSKAINRLRMEQTYLQLTATPKQQTFIDKGKKFVGEVLWNSSKDIATQYAKYTLGTTINKLKGKNIINVNSDSKKEEKKEKKEEKKE